MAMKIFAFATDDRGLHVFPEKEDAISYCEGIDIENGEWLFWDEFGTNLQPVFSKPNQKSGFSVMSGEYDLVPFPAGLELIMFLPNVGYVEGGGMFQDIEEVRNHLTKQSSRTV